MRAENDVAIPSPENFAQQIEDLVWDEDITYMEAVLTWCETRGLEPDLAGDLIKRVPILKTKIQEEAEILNYLPKTSRLAI